MAYIYEKEFRGFKKGSKTVCLWAKKKDARKYYPKAKLVKVIIKEA